MQYQDLMLQPLRSSQYKAFVVFTPIVLNAIHAIVNNKLKQKASLEVSYDKIHFFNFYKNTLFKIMSTAVGEIF